MPNVNVTYQEMQAQATKLSQARSDIDSQLHALQAQVRQLVGGGFVTDAASGAFDASYKEFTDGAKRCMEGLDGMSNYLNKAASTFQDVDSQLAKALG